MPNGENAEFYCMHTKHPVCVLALTKDHEVILAKQFRVGPETVLMELPGGGIEENETSLEAIKRELLEETGYTGDFKFVTRCLECGYGNVNRYCFVATNCQKVSQPKLDECEFVETVIMSLADFRNLLRTGQLTDVDVAYLGLDFLSLL